MSKDEVLKEEKEEKEEKVVSTPIPQTGGANLEEPLMENIKVKKVKYDVGLDDTEEDILELIERNESIEFLFNARELPELSDAAVNKLSHVSRRSYYRELDAKEAFERREQQLEDDDFLGQEFESLASPTFASQFQPTPDELEKYPKGQYVFVHKRPEEVAMAEKAGYKKLGTVEGTPITPSGEKSYANMVRMVLPKDKHDKLVRYFGKKSSARIGGSEKHKKTEFVEKFDDNGEVEATTTFTNDAESVRLKRAEKG